MNDPVCAPGELCVERDQGRSGPSYECVSDPCLAAGQPTSCSCAGNVCGSPTDCSFDTQMLHCACPTC